MYTTTCNRCAIWSHDLSSAQKPELSI